VRDDNRKPHVEVCEARSDLEKSELVHRPCELIRLPSTDDLTLIAPVQVFAVGETANKFSWLATAWIEGCRE
jgi:hypothetical protein